MSRFANLYAGILCNGALRPRLWRRNAGATGFAFYRVGEP